MLWEKWGLRERRVITQQKLKSRIIKPQRKGCSPIHGVLEGPRQAQLGRRHL